MGFDSTSLCLSHNFIEIYEQMFLWYFVTYWYIMEVIILTIGGVIVEIEKNFLTAFIDESGSITKTDIEHHKYFIIAILFTRNSKRIKRYFQKGISSLMKSEKYKKIMEENGEIKGSEVSETKKNKIYDRIIRNCKDDFEIGIIVLDNNYTTKELIKNHARTFNYILQLFFDNSFRNCSKYKNTVTDMHLIIDEQNIATDAEYTLDGYLNQHLTVINPICNHFDVIFLNK